MRHPLVVKGLSVCLIAAAAACSGQSANNSADADNAANAANAAADEAAAPEAEAAAGNNAASPATNTASSTSSTSYQASGSEPFWALAISLGQMTYTPADGAPVSEPLPAQTPIPNGYRYQGAQMTVEIVHTACQDMAENNRPDTVRVIVGGQTVQGCGG